MAKTYFFFGGESLFNFGDMVIPNPKSGNFLPFFGVDILVYREKMNSEFIDTIIFLIFIDIYFYRYIL